MWGKGDEEKPINKEAFDNLQLNQGKSKGPNSRALENNWRLSEAPGPQIV